MRNIKAAQAELRELKRVAEGLPKGDTRKPLDKKIKRLHHKINNLVKEQGGSSHLTIQRLVIKHIKEFEDYFIFNISVDKTLEGFPEWVRSMSQSQLENIIRTEK